MKVYILSTYEEHGAERVQATLDKAKLSEMLELYTIEDTSSSTDTCTEITTEKKRLQEILNTTEEAGSYDLSEGWGGIKLDIAELVE